MNSMTDGLTEKEKKQVENILAAGGKINSIKRGCGGLVIDGFFE